MNIEFLQGLNIDPVPIIIIAFLTWMIRVSLLDRMLEVTSEVLKNNIIFLLPLVVSFLVSLLWVSLTNGIIIQEYLKAVLVNWAFSGFLYKFLKNFFPSNKEVKK